MERRAFLKFLGAAAALAPMTKYLGLSPMPARPLPGMGPVPGVEVEELMVPVGSIYPYAGATAPAGWVICEGQTLSALRYPQLAKALGNSCGGGGRYKVRVPDMRVRPGHSFTQHHDDGPPTPLSVYPPPSYLIRVA